MIIRVASQGAIDMILAVEATIGGIGLILHILHLMRGQQFQPRPHDLSEFHRLLAFSLRQAGRHSHDSQGFMLQLLRGHTQHKTAVDTPRIGDEQSILAAHPSTQRLELLVIVWVLDHNVRRQVGTGSPFEIGARAAG